jgi:hypothetical protein
MEHTLAYRKTPTYSGYRKRQKKNHTGANMLTEQQFQQISAKVCHYCGVAGPNGIDRVDCAKGYELTNCVPCCKHCNYVKGNLSMEDFHTWTERFVTHQTRARQER